MATARSLSPPKSKQPESDMTITAGELQAELDSLRSLRRRSLSRPSDALDPDLPSSSRSPPLPTSPTLISPPTSPAEASDLPLSLSNGIDSTASTTAAATTGDTPLSDLMWLPAHLHPDIAPQEFRAFLAEQTKPEALLRRTGSLDRKRSMLSKQYHPSERDGVEQADETSSSSSETSGSQRRRQPLERLTISDLQRLEALAVEASAEDGGQSAEGKEGFSALLRRSMSLGPQSDNVPIDVDSQPIVAHAPGSLIRRTARTKIRKPSLAGDGGGHRFGPSKRGTAGKSQSEDDVRQVEDRRASITDSDELHDEPLSAPITPPRSPSASPTKPILPPSVEPPIREPPPVLVMPSPLPHGARPGVTRSPVGSSPPSEPALLSPAPKPPRAPSPGTDERSLRPAPEIPARPATSKSPPPPAPIPVTAPAPSSDVPAPVVSPISPSTSPSSPAVKEKKSTWARLGLAARAASPKPVDVEEEDQSDTASIASTASGSSTKKGKKAKEGVFGSLFRSKGKELEAPAPVEEPVQVAISPTASGMLNKDGKYTNFYRLPIHVERAVYRLSHIKLANPRRPLYEQVLISNLMFWYLGVINKPSMPAPPPLIPAPAGYFAAGPADAQPIDGPPPADYAPSSTPGPPATVAVEPPIPVRRMPTDSGFEVIRRNGPTPEGAWMSKAPRTGPTPVVDADDDDAPLANALHLVSKLDKAARVEGER